MPIEKYIKVEFKASNKFDRWRHGMGGFLYEKRIEIPTDIAVVYGHPKGESSPSRFIFQELDFSTIEYSTIKEAIEWLNKRNIHGYHEIKSPKKGGMLEYEGTHKGKEFIHVLFEAFYSLRRELNQAVVTKFGKYSYVSDFSDKEVIIGYTSESPEGASYQTDKYTKVGYKFKNGEITFVGTPKEVERKTVYEGIKIDGYVWATLTLNEKFLRDKAKEE